MPIGSPAGSTGRGSTSWARSSRRSSGGDGCATCTTTTCSACSRPTSRRNRKCAASNTPPALPMRPVPTRGCGSARRRNSSTVRSPASSGCARRRCARPRPGLELVDLLPAADERSVARNRSARAARHRARARGRLTRWKRGCYAGSSQRGSHGTNRCVTVTTRSPCWPCTKRSRTASATRTRRRDGSACVAIAATGGRSSASAIGGNGSRPIRDRTPQHRAHGRTRRRVRHRASSRRHGSPAAVPDLSVAVRYRYPNMLTAAGRVAAVEVPTGRSRCS